MSRFFGVKSSDQSRNTSRNHRRILGETLEPRQLLAANVYRVNAGGAAYIDRQGQLWEADNYFESGFTYETDQISEIHRTSDDELYFTERASGALKYAFPVANGSYTVNLHMAEIHWDDFGKRVFDVYLEEDRVESNIDIYKRTLNAFNPGKGTAYTYSENVVVEDGVLNVLMTSHVDNAKVSAIEILPVSGASLILTETNGDTVVSESGQTDSYGLRLNTKPTHAVTVSIAAGPGITTTSRSLQFNPWNWQSQKTNSIIAIDDNSGSGTEETFVRHILSSADPNYNGQVVDLKVIREDDEISFTTKKIAGVPRPTTVAWGPDGRIYVGSTTGDIHALTVDDNYNVVSQQTIGTLRNFSNQNILGVAFNPTEVAEYPTIYVSHSQLYANSGSAFPSTQQSPYSGQVSTLEGPHYNQLKPLITGLPVSNHDHGVNGLQFDNQGDLYIAVGGTTNAGVKHTKLGGLDESPFSAAILKAEITKPDFNGEIQYELPDNLTGELEIPGNLAFDPATSQYWGGVARVVDGVDVSVYASGLRNPYDLVWTTSGKLYSTDNAANTGFGEVSTGANTQEPFSTPRAWDELNLIEEGNYYGHPNRNRGQTDTRQNIYYDAHDESIEGIYTEELAQIAPATGGITEYIADTFDGQLRWDLLVQRWNDDAVTIPVESLQSPAAEATVNELPVSSGLDLTVAPGGTIVGVDYSENAVTVAIPDTTERRMVAYDMLPWRASPGAKFVIGGKGFGSLKSTQVFIGGAKAQLHRVSPTRIEGTIPVFSPNKSIDQVARQPVIIESSGQTDLLEAGLFPLSLDAPNLHTESVVSINAGGPQYVDANGETWLADQFFSGGNSFSVAESISGTVDDRLYQSERFGSFSYNIPVDNGTYNVELHLAEVFFDAPNERVFGVTAEAFKQQGLSTCWRTGLDSKPPQFNSTMCA